MKRQRITAFITATIIFTAGIGLVRFPREISAAVQTNLTLCTNTLLPGLFPFFVLSSLVIKLELLRPVEHIMDQVMQRVFHLPGSCSSALVLGMIGGYPTGAKVVTELYRSASCSKDEGERALSFCNNCGPAFLFGMVGCTILGDPHYGALLTAVHYTAAILTGMIINRSSAISATYHKHSNHTTASLSAAFVDSVTGALRSLLDLCSFVLCFGAITKLLDISGILSRTASILLPFLSTEAGESFLLGVLELTHGIVNLSNEPLPTKLILFSALLGWGGISVHCQVLALLRDTDLSPVCYLKGKALHTALSASLMWIILYRPEMTIPAVGCTLLLASHRNVKKRSGKAVKSIV